MSDATIPDTSLAAVVHEAADRIRAAGMTETPRLDAELLACHAFDIDRVEVHVRARAQTGAGARDRFEQLVQRRLLHEPVQYIVGRAWFRQLEIAVDPRVLIPRPESEMLVEWALEHVHQLRARDPGHVVRVLDMCTGSGAIAAAIADEAPEGVAAVVGSELSPAALELAHENVATAGVEVELVEGDLWVPLTGRSFDVVVTNPPYVSPTAASSMSPTVVDHEPHVALFVDQDEPLGFVRRILAGARTALAPGGLLAMEIGAGQEDVISAEFGRAGMRDIEQRRDLAGIIRTIGGFAP